MNDEFEELSRIAASGSKAAFPQRVDRERRLQTRSRRIRKTCRYTILAAGIGAFALLWLGSNANSNFLMGLGCFLFLPTLIAGAVLFFMGGLAPGRTSVVLSRRERDLLDK